MRHIVRLARRKLPMLGLATIGVVSIAGAAAAMDTCSGEFSASPLRPIPSPAVVGLDLSDSSSQNSALASAFSHGLTSAGIMVPGSRPATVNLRLTWQILGQGGSNPGSGGNALVPMQPGSSSTGASLWSGNSQTFLQGGIERSLPDMPNYGVFSRGQPVQSGLLIFRAEARDTAGNTIYWIASVQCTLKSGDNDMLAYQLGQLIGSSIGQRRERVAI